MKIKTANPNVSYEIKGSPESLDVIKQTVTKNVVTTEVDENTTETVYTTTVTRQKGQSITNFSI